MTGTDHYGRVYVTADWHIGHNADTVRSQSGINSRLFDLMKFAQVLGGAAALTGSTVSPSLIVTAGDVFDSPNPSNEDRAALVRLVSHLVGNSESTHVALMPGNHDCDLQWSSLSGMEGWEYQRKVMVVGAYPLRLSPNTLLVPNPTREELVKMESEAGFMSWVSRTAG